MHCYKAGCIRTIVYDPAEDDAAERPFLARFSPGKGSGGPALVLARGGYVCLALASWRAHEIHTIV